MSCKPYIWPATREEVLALVEPVLRASLTMREAAERLGRTEAALRGVCRAQRIDFRAMLRAAIVPPVAYPVQESSPGQESEALPPPPVDWTGARPQTTGAGLERRLILSDTHFPFAAVRACAAVIALARVIQPHVILHLGDAWNAGAVSRHPRPFGGRENHASARAQGLSFFDALARASPGARRILLSGNHDDWLLEFEDERPEFAGMFAAKWIGLDRLGWGLVARAQQPIVLGPVSYAHGTGGGEYYAKRYALHSTIARCHVRGHHHSMQHHQARNGIEAWGAGWLGRPEPSAFDYAKEKGHWETGCLVQDVIGDRVATTPVRLEHGAALFGGRLIAA